LDNLGAVGASILIHMLAHPRRLEPSPLPILEHLFMTLLMKVGNTIHDVCELCLVLARAKGCEGLKAGTVYANKPREGEVSAY